MKKNSQADRPGIVIANFTACYMGFFMDSKNEIVGGILYYSSTREGQGTFSVAEGTVLDLTFFRRATGWVFGTK